jgi:hypothetical protein
VWSLTTIHCGATLPRSWVNKGNKWKGRGVMPRPSISSSPGS